MRLKARVINTWEAMRTSYWFVPSVMSLGAVLLSLLVLAIDRTSAGESFRTSIWLYTGSAEGARSLLSTIASSLVSVAGVTFSITIVALTLASNQFGPRLLRNFMRDLGNQIVLGTFLSSFLYCLLILRQVHEGSDDYDRFIPQVSILVAVAMAITNVGVLIYFIHHIASSIQSPHVIATVATDMHKAINTLYPERIGESPGDWAKRHDEFRRQIPETFDAEAVLLCTDTGGYLQRIQADQLLEEAVDRDLLVRVDRRPGQFLIAGEVVLRAWPTTRVDDAVRENLRGCFTIGWQRMLSQDAEFAVDQLVEIALLALSPGVNDAFTAIMVVDRLGETLAHLAERAMPSPYRVDKKGRLRVIAQSWEFSKTFDAAFTQIRQNSARNLAVMLRLFRAVRGIAARLHDPADTSHVRRFVEMVYAQAMETARQEHDRQAVTTHYQASLQVLERVGQV